MLHPDLRTALQTPDPDALRIPLLRSTLYLPLKGLNKYGAGTGELATRSVKKVPHVRIFLVEEELRATPRIGGWHRRLTGMEFCADLPADHGIEITDGEQQIRLGADAADTLRSWAAEDLASLQADAQTRYPRLPLGPDPESVDHRTLGRHVAEIFASQQGWDAAQLVIRMAGETHQAELNLTDADDTRPAEVSPELLDQIATERQAQSRPGVGAWFSLSAQRQSAPNQRTAPRVPLNWDHEPAWQPAVDPAVYLREQELFPRSAEWMPVWLKIRLQEAREAQ